MKNVSCVILDLDNTLYDWFNMWHSSFRPMLDEVVSLSGKSEADIKSEFKKIHEEKGTSEYAFRIHDSALLASAAPDMPIDQFYRSALEAERIGRDSSLELYPGVLKTLHHLKAKGTKIVAYTDSMGFYIALRLKRLGLDGVIDTVYTTQDHDVPTSIDPLEMRSRPNSYYKLEVTEHKTIPKGEIKPNPRVLKDILADLGVSGDECIYIGDSLDRDIKMAQDANIDDVWAKYGKDIDQAQYELLRDVTHWRKSDVEREKDADSPRAPISPTFEINQFDGVINLFNFVPFLNQKDNTNNLIALWKTSVDVQMHFNEIEMKVRNLYFGIISALFIIYGYLLRTDGITIYEEFTICAFVILISLLFYFVDRYWYHRLLYGSVLQGIELETAIKRNIPEANLALGIKDQSSFEAPKFLQTMRSWPGIGFLVCRFFGDQNFEQHGRIHSNAKISVLYKSIAVLAFFWAVFRCFTA